MVKRAKQTNRRAFTLIELVFAIVVISIAVVTLPMMIQVNNKGIEDSMVQEAIFAASAELMGASAGYWDANSMADNAVSHLSRVIDIGVIPCNNDNNDTRFRLRPGHIAQPLHRRCLDSNTTIASNASGGLYSLDDADDGITSKVMFTDNVTEEEGYKQTYRSLVSVNQDAANPNIKHVNINVTDSNGNLVTILRMQSANIGEIDYYKRML